MRTGTPEFEAALAGNDLRPVYVVAITFDKDTSDITYITSGSNVHLPPGVAPIDRIDGAITPKGISSQSQKIIPAEARHTIGNMRITIQDIAGAFTTKIKNKEASNLGLWKKRIQVYTGFEHFESFDDYLLQLTYITEKVEYLNGEYPIYCSDINRTVKTKIMQIHQGVLTSTIGPDDMTIPITIPAAASKFPLLSHDARYRADASQAVGYIKIDDERISHSGWNATFTGLNVVERGALNTKAVEHVVTELEDDKKKKIEEHTYLEMASPRMIYALLTGIDAGGKNIIEAPLDLLDPGWDVANMTITESSEAPPIRSIKLWNLDDSSATQYGYLIETLSPSDYVDGDVYTLSTIIRHDASKTVPVMLRLFFGGGGPSYTDVSLTMSTGLLESITIGTINRIKYWAFRVGDFWHIGITANGTGNDTNSVSYSFYPAVGNPYSPGAVQDVDICLPFMGKGDVHGWSFNARNHRLCRCE